MHAIIVPYYLNSDFVMNQPDKQLFELGKSCHQNRPGKKSFLPNTKVTNNLRRKWEKYIVQPDY
jgi:hypothetical protein